MIPRGTSARDTGTRTLRGAAARRASGLALAICCIASPGLAETGGLDWVGLKPIGSGTSPVWYFVAALAVLAAAAALLLLRRRQARARSGRMSPPRVAGPRDAGPIRDATAPAAKEAFARARTQFSDLYGELWSAAELDDESEENRRAALGRWRERIERLADAALLAAWRAVERADGAKARLAAQAWLRNLERWGLTRIHPPSIDVNEASLRQFHVFPHRSSGRAKVVQPCWAFEGAVLEKGHASLEGAAPGA